MSTGKLQRALRWISLWPEIMGFKASRHGVWHDCVIV
jgi:hypothetical protein